MRNGVVLDGRYRIEQKLAAGGFGAIYRATDLVMGREVALKVLHAELAGDESVVERFRREAAALARLRDPHTITMYDVGHSADGTRYIVMELLRGESLHSLFLRHGRLPWQRVVAIARGVCSSLREAHAFQIVHRDLKPANIHLERHSLEADYVKVLDFGIAKMVDGSDVMQPALTIVGQLVGTYDYMSPEQMLGGTCSGRADVFALGVVIYEMITGVRPYGPDANGPASMLMALLGTEPALLSTHVDVPPALDRVVMTALAQDPKERLDVDELDEALAFILDAERGLALGTMDVPAAASSSSLAADTAARGSSLDLDRDRARLDEDDDDATWIDQVPQRTTPAQPRDTPTTFGPVPTHEMPVPTIIGTLPAMRTPPRGVPLAAAASIAPKQVPRKTPLRGTPPPELQRKVSSVTRASSDAKPDAHARTEAHEAVRQPPLRRTPLRGTPPLPAKKPPGGQQTSAPAEEFTRIETPRGLASGTTRPPSKPSGSRDSAAASIEQAIAEEIDHAVDAMVASSPKAELALPRPGSPAQAGIWPAPERVRPLTVRFAVGSGTELPSLDAGTKPEPAPSAPVPAPVNVRSPVIYVAWALALFGVGFAAALGIGLL